MNRAFALTIGLLAALAPAMARAQTNIDQGKSASQIFSNACAECHKSASGLGKGKNAAAVAEFLREHYTTGRDQAASLAAYVVGGRDSVASPAAKKPPPERTGAATTTDETKQDKRHGQKPAKPEEGASTSGLPTFMNPIVRPEPPQRDNRPATANRNRRKEPAGAPEAPQEPAAVARVPAPAVTEPAHSETPVPEAPPATATTPAAVPTPTAAVPVEVPTGETGEPVSRDNIPD